MPIGVVGLSRDSSPVAEPLRARTELLSFFRASEPLFRGHRRPDREVASRPLAPNSFQGEVWRVCRNEFAGRLFRSPGVLPTEKQVL